MTPAKGPSRHGAHRLTRTEAPKQVVVSAVAHRTGGDHADPFSLLRRDLGITPGHWAHRSPRRTASRASPTRFWR